MFIVFVVYISFSSRFVSFLFVCTPFLLVSLTQPDRFVPHSSSTLLREFSLKLVYAPWQHGAFKFCIKKSLKIYVIYYFFTNGWHPTTTTRRVISMEMQKTKQRARRCRVIGRSFAKPCSAFIVTTSSIGTETKHVRAITRFQQQHLLQPHWYWHWSPRPPPPRQPIPTRPQPRVAALQSCWQPNPRASPSPRPHSRRAGSR